MQAINQGVHCERMDVIRALLGEFVTDQTMLELWVLSFSPLPWHGLRSLA